MPRLCVMCGRDGGGGIYVPLSGRLARCVCVYCFVLLVGSPRIVRPPPCSIWCPSHAHAHLRTYTIHSTLYTPSHPKRI